MKHAQHTVTLHRLSIAATCAALVACGGGGSDAPQNSSTTQTAALINGSTATSAATSILKGPITTTVPVPMPAPAIIGGIITDVRFENTSTSADQTNVPVTFGQVFAKGSVLATDTLTGRLEDGTTVPLQLDVKATHADGSVRHAIISAIVPNIAAGKLHTMSLSKGGSAPTGTVAVDSLIRTGFSASIHARIGGVDYYASADDLLKSGKATTWLAGPVATEWQVSAPLRAANGGEHAHLSARFAIRWYPGANKARVDVVVENAWAYEPAPQNLTYDATVVVGGQTVYSKAGLTHYHHARWRKLFWFNGTEPAVNVKHNSSYLIASGALPNYDQSIVIPENAITGVQKRWNESPKDAMGNGLITMYMPTTGLRDDIGLLPNWGVTYLLSQDARMKEITLRNADLAGSFSSHYRDKKTGRPVSLADYPYMTVGLRNDTYNPATKQYESFPECAGAGKCDTPYTHDASHQPAVAYLPYLITGDYYYLEELQFWAMWDAFEVHPAYRQQEKGILASEQVRGQAWSLRTLAEAAYISPDMDVLKAPLTTLVNNNLDWYNTTYVTNTANPQYANKLGVIVNGYALAYDNGLGIAPWQDDFFTAAVGHAAEMGFSKANSLLTWKAQFPIDRMVGEGACWIDAAIYQMHVRSAENAPWFSSIGEAYANSHTPAINALKCGSAEMAAAFGLKIGEMTGWADGATGYPSTMQPALAYARNAGGTAGQNAWSVYAGRAVKPDFRYAPQFAIVPR